MRDTQGQVQNKDKTGVQADMQALKDELHAAFEFLNSPPKEAYADIGGAPKAPDHTQTGEAKQWQRKALQLLRRMYELIDALSKHGALPAAGSSSVKQQQTIPAIEEFGLVSGASFWRDITSVASSKQHSSSSAGAEKQMSLGSSVASGSQNGHAGKSTLIQEIDSKECRQKQSAKGTSRTGLIVEELSDAESEHAEEPWTMDNQDLIMIVLTCALHGQDCDLNAPWASQEGSAIATSILSSIAKALGSSSRGSDSESGKLALAAGYVQDILLQLLPGTLSELSAVIFPAQQQDNNARFQAYKGPDTFERAKAAQKMAWLIRRLGSKALGDALGPALPCMQAAATDPSPAVHASGLWALHHISQEALPGDLRIHKGELARVTVKALVACDERAWAAAASAACGTAVAVHGKDIYGEGYRAVMGEMLTQGNSYSHVPARRTVWLKAMQPLFQALGLANVRHFSQLLPLLLDWLHASDAETRLLAVQALRIVMRQTWPRLPTHAHIVWDHLAAEYKTAEPLASEPAVLLPCHAAEERDGTASSKPKNGSRTGKESSAKEEHLPSSGDAVSSGSKEGDLQLSGTESSSRSRSRQELSQAIVETAEVVWWAGGDAFRERLQQAPPAMSGGLLQRISEAVKHDRVADV